MTISRHRSRLPHALLVGGALIAAACNASTAAGDNPEELGFAGDATTTTTAPATTTGPTTTTAPTATTESTMSDEFDGVAVESTIAEPNETMGSELLTDGDVELITSLLETEVGRQLFIDGMMEDSSLTTEQAECFVDTADLTTLLSFSGGTQAENAALVDLFSTLSECDIDMNDFDG